LPPPGFVAPQSWSPFHSFVAPRQPEKGLALFHHGVFQQSLKRARLASRADGRGRVEKRILTAHSSPRTTETRFAAVMPSSAITVSPGALMPKRSIPTTVPALPTYFHHRPLTPASIATRFAQDAGSTS